METDPGDVTKLLLQIRRGNRGAEQALIQLVYAELRRIAARALRKERAAHSLQPTLLVHEAYLRLTRIQEVDWQGRSHFFAVSATLMRQILVGHARKRQALKRPAADNSISIHEETLPAPGPSHDILAVDEALDRLALVDPRQCKVVEMRFFAGMNEEETGQALGISPRTVRREWRMAKAWLRNELHC